ncbi:MAG: LacI family DNA-binding transcriptional regulator [Phycisphaeraceae bacterium JB051]
MNTHSMLTNKPTIAKATVGVKELAQHAGVSVGTVSRVLNGETSVSPKRRQAVQKAIQSLGYKRTSAAQMLASRRSRSITHTGNIAMVFVGMSENWQGHPTTAALINGVDQACNDSSFHPLLETCTDDRHLPRCIANGKVDGLLIKSSNVVPRFLDQLPDYLPRVLVGMAEPTLACNQVLPDHRASAWIATEHLWSKGHRRIAFVNNQDMHRIFISRFQAYEQLLRSRRAFDPQLVVLNETPPGFEPEANFPDMSFAVEQLWALDDPPTAIVAANDWMAAGLYQALKKRGLTVGKDVSVIGFDNVLSVCCMLEPQLTSYEIPLQDVSRHATRLLMNLIENPADNLNHSTQMLPGRLIERDSVVDLNA